MGTGPPDGRGTGGGFTPRRWVARADGFDNGVVRTVLM